MEVQWLRIQASTARVIGSIPGWGTKMPCGAAKKKKKPQVFKMDNQQGPIV